MNFFSIGVVVALWCFALLPAWTQELDIIDPDQCRQQFTALSEKHPGIDHFQLLPHFLKSFTNCLPQLVTYGRYKVARDELDEAEHYLKRAYQIDPNDFYVLDGLGRVYSERRDDEVAAAYFKRVVELGLMEGLDNNLLRKTADYAGRVFHAADLFDLETRVYKLAIDRGIWESIRQRAGNEYVKGLPSQPFFENNGIEFIRILEEGYPTIRAEFEHIYSVSPDIFPSQGQNLVSDKSMWREFRIGARHTEHRKLFPNTLKVIDAMLQHVELADDQGSVKFSIMEEGAEVAPHCGPTNARLRAHLGIIVPKGAYIKVAGEVRAWEEGKVLFFDDSYDHEVWHHGKGRRVVLIVDVWHPLLNDEQRQQVGLARLRNAKPNVVGMRFPTMKGNADDVLKKNA
eukprot:Rmarinus@m.1043